jgi:hypothetical protein
MKWTPEARAAWEKTRAKGRNHFVFVRGVCTWGGVMCVAMTLVNHVLYIRGIRAMPFDTNLLANLAICGLTGYLWGSLTWKLMEKSYIEDSREIHP